ncbi:MAG: ABC transporter substrate-binding protein [Propionibacteriaceae bacterium]|jgi:peptide/nickel transport system substrate-binding protein|nr:ABC transporter substrate-binding protein [Propionibacteriaceae bacterium]
MTSVFRVVTDQGTTEFNDAYRNVTGSAGYIVSANIYNRVVLHEWDSPVVYPDLATHWEALDSARVHRFYLNHAAKWHDGVPLTSHDVAFTHAEQRAKGYQAASSFAGVREIVEVDRHTVDYVLDRPDAAFRTKLGNFITAHVLPAHLYEGTDWATNPHNQDPVGSGPFRVAEWVPGGNVVMEAVKDHWGPGPLVDRIELIVVDDLDEGVRMVARGDADYMVQDVLTFDRLHLLDGFDPSKFYVTAQRGAGMARVEFNFRHPVWGRLAARQSIAHVMDRTAFDEKLFDEGVSRSWDHYLIPNVAWAFDESVSALGHDVAAAERLLDEAGLPRGADGVRHRMKLFYMHTFGWHGDIARPLSEQLRAIGIEAEPVALRSPEWKATVDDGGEFDFVVSGGGMAPDPGVLASRYHSASPANWIGYANPEVDAIFDEAQITIDQAARGDLFRKLQRVWADDVTFVPCYWYGHYFARSPRFFGWADQLQYSVPFWHWGRVRPVAQA